MTAHRSVLPFGSQERLYALAPDIEVKTRLHSRDYGDGTVVAFLPTGVQMMWDDPDKGEGPQLSMHDPLFVAKLERI